MSAHELNDEQREVRDLARRFAEAEIAPHAAAWDRDGLKLSSSEIQRLVIARALLGEVALEPASRKLRA